MNKVNIIFKINFAKTRNTFLVFSLKNRESRINSIAKDSGFEMNDGGRMMKERL